MANTYKRINAASTSSGGGSGTPYSQTFLTATWSGPSGGYYTITILESTHGKGTDPGVEVYETSGTDDDQVTIDRIRVNSSGDVELRVPSSPDLRFDGKVVILD